MQELSFNLHLFHISDTHGHLTSDSYNDQIKQVKGLARLSNYFKSISYENQIRIDCGDTIQGSPFAYIYKEMKNQNQNPFSTAINHLNFDYYIPGNHDFNYGLNYLNDFIKKLNSKTLCSNVFINNKLYFDYSYDIKSFENGPKIAVIGITNNYIPNWESKGNIKDLEFINAFDSAKSVINQIKKEHQVDLIVVGYHGGYECNLETNENEAKNSDENLGCKIFNQLTDIDILLTGHEHRLILLNKNNRVMLQPGYGASHVSHTNIRFIMKDSKWKIDKIIPELISMKDYDDDQELILKVSDFINNANQKLNQIIGKTKTNFLIEDQIESRIYKHKLFQYINEVQIKTTNAMISCSSLGNDVSGFNKTIRLKDVLNTYIFPNTLFLCEITGKTLLNALNHNKNFFTINDKDEINIDKSYLYPKLELYNYDVFDNIEYEIIVKKNKENEVINVKYNSKPICEDDLFTIVLNSYRMSGGGNINWHKDLKIIKSFPLDLTELLINDIKNKKIIDIEYKNNVIVRKDF